MTPVHIQNYSDIIEKYHYSVIRGYFNFEKKFKALNFILNSAHNNSNVFFNLPIKSYIIYNIFPKIIIIKTIKVKRINRSLNIIMHPSIASFNDMHKLKNKLFLMQNNIHINKTINK